MKLINWMNVHSVATVFLFFGFFVLLIIKIFNSPTRREKKLRRETQEQPITLFVHAFSEHCFKVVIIYKEMVYVQVGGADLIHSNIEPKDKFYVTKDVFPTDLFIGDLFIVREHSGNKFSLVKTNDQHIFHGIKKVEFIEQESGFII